MVMDDHTPQKGTIMDPEITLQEINTALDNGDIETAREYHEYLTEWLVTGHYTPFGYTATMARLSDAMWLNWVAHRLPSQHPDFRATDQLHSPGNWPS